MAGLRWLAILLIISTQITPQTQQIRWLWGDSVHEASEVRYWKFPMDTTFQLPVN